jgi:hypothetical protein
MIVPLRRKRAVAPEVAPLAPAHGPFAALAALKR